MFDGPYCYSFEPISDACVEFRAGATTLPRQGQGNEDVGEGIDGARCVELERRQRKNALTPATEDNDNAAYIDSLGWVLFRKGQFESARAELEKAVALPDGDDAVLWDHLGDVCFRLNQPDRARQAWLMRA